MEDGVAGGVGAGGGVGGKLIGNVGTGIRQVNETGLHLRGWGSQTICS